VKKIGGGILKKVKKKNSNAAKTLSLDNNKK